MSRPVQLILAAVIGLAASAAFNAARGEALLLPGTALAFTLATLLTVVAGWLPLPGRRPRRTGKPDAAGSAEREQGIVKWFNISKGFGFIIGDSGEEIFVHQRQLTKSAGRGLQQGQRVSYRVAGSERGPQAEAVEVLGGGDDERADTRHSAPPRRRRN